MADMNKMFELANSMFGSKSAESSDGSDTTTTKTIIAEALSDSHDGIVKVYISDGVILDRVSAKPESPDVVGVDLPTTVAVEQGDDVLVSMFGSRGALTPVVTGVVGKGDKQKAEIAGATDAAQAASDAAADASQEAKDATATSIFAKNLASNADTKADGAQAAADTAQSTANSALQKAEKVNGYVKETDAGLVVSSDSTQTEALISYDGDFRIMGKDGSNRTKVASFSKNMVELASGNITIHRDTSDLKVLNTMGISVVDHGYTGAPDRPAFYIEYTNDNAGYTGDGTGISGGVYHKDIMSWFPPQSKFIGPHLDVAGEIISTGLDTEDISAQSISADRLILSKSNGLTVNNVDILARLNELRAALQPTIPYTNIDTKYWHIRYWCTNGVVTISVNSIGNGHTTDSWSNITINPNNALPAKIRPPVDVDFAPIIYNRTWAGDSTLNITTDGKIRIINIGGAHTSQQPFRATATYAVARRL